MGQTTDGNEILLQGDRLLTELKKNPNHITQRLNRPEEISYNSGFHAGYVEGYNAAKGKTEKLQEQVARLAERIRQQATEIERLNQVQQKQSP
jgi:flagellar biosynthesis/type III secretory pathway protein FliH